MYEGKGDENLANSDRSESKKYEVENLESKDNL